MQKESSVDNEKDVNSVFNDSSLHAFEKFDYFTNSDI